MLGQDPARLSRSDNWTEYQRSPYAAPKHNGVKSFLELGQNVYTEYTKYISILDTMKSSTNSNSMSKLKDFPPYAVVNIIFIKYIRQWKSFLAVLAKQSLLHL